MRVVLAFHVIAMVAWFAGLFYLPRLFVYHADAKDEISHQRFIIMERRLFWAITTPAAIVTIGLGLWLLCVNWAFYQTQDWMFAKIALVCGLVAYHVWCGVLQKRFARGANKHPSTFYRFFNEVPTIGLILIILLVFTQPAWL